MPKTPTWRLAFASPGVKATARRKASRRFTACKIIAANIRAIVEQQLVDIMLMSVSTSDALTVRERLFETSPITPAIRANDTSDIWLYGTQSRVWQAAVDAVSHGDHR